MQIWIMSVSCKRPPQKKKNIKRLQYQQWRCSEVDFNTSFWRVFFPLANPTHRLEQWTVESSQVANSEAAAKDLAWDVWRAPFRGDQSFGQKRHETFMKLLGDFFQFVSTLERNSNANVVIYPSPKQSPIITNKHQQSPTTSK